jgi:hypothetical protein
MNSIKTHLKHDKTVKSKEMHKICQANVNEESRHSGISIRRIRPRLVWWLISVVTTLWKEEIKRTVIQASLGKNARPCPKNN